MTPTQLPGFLPGGISYLGEQSSYRKLLRELGCAAAHRCLRATLATDDERDLRREHVRRMRQPPESYEKRAKRFAAEEADRRRSWSRAALRGWTHAGGPAKLIEIDRRWATFSAHLRHKRPRETLLAATAS